MRNTSENPLARLLIIVSLLSGPASAYSAVAFVERASSAGARLDSDLLRGGGTDDTPVLQRVLDVAADGRPVHLIIDGPALVSGLNVYGNTTVECNVGGGLYLRDNSSRAIIRNAHRSRGAITDERIQIRGCFLNGNRDHQPSAAIAVLGVPGWTGPSNKEKDGTFITGLQFLGVNDLTIEGVTLWNVRSFASLIGNASRVDIRNVTLDCGVGPAPDSFEFGWTDGLHFAGPLRYVTIDSVKIRLGDDGIAFNANDSDTDDLTVHNDFGPYVGQGPITDVLVSNVQLMDTDHAFRIFSTNQRIDRISISNVVGTIAKDWLLQMGHWSNPHSFGNIGKITLRNVNVDRPPMPLVAAGKMASARKDKIWYGETNGGDVPLINVNSHVESLQIQHVMTTIGDARPLLRVGPDAAVGSMDVGISAIDPALQGVILKLDQGGHIDRLRLSLAWHGKVLDQGKDPIDRQGGTIGQLVWVDTPPMYLGSHTVRSDPSIIDVRFSEVLKSPVSAGGANVAIDDQPTGISSAALQPDGMTVRYRLSSPIRAGAHVVWSYNENTGSLKNLDGAHLRTVSSKSVSVSTE